MIGSTTNSGEVSRLLAEWSAGDPQARDRLVPLVYEELKLLANVLMKRERAGHTLQPTALVNEAFLRFFQQREVPTQGRGQFLALISQMMRRVLVDHARRHQAKKRGPDVTRVTLNEDVHGAPAPEFGVLDLDGALRQLGDMDPRQSEIVELRVFGGFGVNDVAEVVGVSPATVKREWMSAKAWLYRELCA